MSNTAVLENALLPLRPLLAREDVTELVINKAGEAAIETSDVWSWETLPALNEKSLLALARAAAAFTHQDISQYADLLHNPPQRRACAAGCAACCPCRHSVHHHPQAVIGDVDDGGFRARWAV